MATTDPPTVMSPEAQQAFLDLFAPIMDKLTKEAQVEIDRFDAAFSADHNAIGRVLRVHLVIEQYLNEHIKAKYKIKNLDELRLSFSQKTALLQDDLSPAAWVKSAIQNVNAVRNKFTAALDDHVTIECRDRDEIEFGKMQFLAKVDELSADGFEHITRVCDQVHLVDCQYNVADTEQRGDDCVPPRLCL